MTFSSLTTAQKDAIRAGIAAETDPTIVTARTVRDDVTLTAWCNGLSATSSWKYAATKRDLFEAMTITKFDGLTAGKRDAYVVMMENAPIDFGRQPMRKAVDDIWGNTDSVAVLQALTEMALRVENYIGGSSETTNTVSATDRTQTGPISLTDLSKIMNGQ